MDTRKVLNLYKENVKSHDYIEGKYSSFKNIKNKNCRQIS